MTEKRFTYKHFDWLQWHIYKDGEFFIEVTNCEEDAKMLCELLNAQHEEIQRLDEKWVDEHSLNETLRLEVQRLEAENEQLKQQLFETSKELLWATSDEVDRALYYEDEVEELRKEIFE